MAKLVVSDTRIEGYYEILVEVEFENPLSATDIIRVLHIIVETTTSKFASNLFEGLGSLAIDEATLAVRFRRSDAKIEINPYPEHELHVLKMQFIFYLFAKIDHTFKLVDVPFPSDFREFIHLPDYL